MLWKADFLWIKIGNFTAYNIIYVESNGFKTDIGGDIMKKFTVILVLVLSLLVLSGCGQKKTFRIGVSQCSSDDWRSKMNEEIEREMMFHADAEVEIRSADDDSQRQIEDLRYFVDNDFDIIIVAPNEEEPLTPVVREIYESGIPVVIFDRDINGDSYTARIGVDNVGLGRSAAFYAANLEKGRCNVIEIRGLEGSTPASERHKGFKTVADSLTTLNMIASGCAKWNQEDAVALADSLLRLYPQANLVYAHNDRMAIGASMAAKRLGRDDIKIIGIDAAPEIGIKAVVDSVIDATFLYPTEGHRLIRRALDILNGSPYPKDEMLPLASAVDLSNADILLLQNASLREETDKMQMLKKQIDKYWQQHSSQTTLFYATLVILLLMLVMVFLLLRSFWVARRHRVTLEDKNRLLEEERDKQKILNDQLASATQSKLAFFTNVSHDLRTPLTLISDPVAQMASATNLTPQQHTLMQIAHKNVKILMRLINQVLDFRKYESGRLQLAAREVDFKESASEWLQSFVPLVRKRHIKFKIRFSEHDDYRVAIDVEKIERVVFNLLSNAFKYTPDNGSIEFSAACKDGKLIFSVEDTGIGISSDEIERVFDNFYQVETIRPKGSGIGLWLSRSLVELHGGSIDISSVQGKGSVFTVEIPVRHVSEDVSEVVPAISSTDVDVELSAIDNAAMKPSLDCINPSGVESGGNAEVADSEEESRPIVLVIDDSSDMRLFITELLKERYRVIRAANGKEGVRMASKFVPDLIICDVMMPEMDGMECCRIIKEEVSTSHIPVLMLTACALDEQRTEGYASGADGYLSKPFSTGVLLARCDSLIANRRRIRNLWQSKNILKEVVEDSKGGCPREMPVAPSPDTGAVADIDSEFYNRFLAIVRNDLANPDLSVDAMAARMGLGRSQFYRKIKALTNYSPVELLRNLRLQHARALLTSTEKSISEIAYETGFSTPAYFTKCFRDSFGMTPTDLRTHLS